MRSTAQPSPSGRSAGREAGEEGAHLRRALLVVDVGDLRLVPGRVGGDVALQRHGDVDDAAGQRLPPSKFAALVAAGLSIRGIGLSPREVGSACKFVCSYVFGCGFDENA